MNKETKQTLMNSDLAIALRIAPGTSGMRTSIKYLTITKTCSKMTQIPNVANAALQARSAFGETPNFFKETKH
jgi:hypothetical protein